MAGGRNRHWVKSKGLIVMATGTAMRTEARHPEDIAVWPDGFWAPLSELHSGGFNHRSDDFEVVPHDDLARMQELGIADEITD
jgi:hypothetical protein